MRYFNIIRAGGEKFNEFFEVMCYYYTAVALRFVILRNSTYPSIILLLLYF